MDYKQMIGQFLSDTYRNVDEVAGKIARSDNFKKFTNRVLPGTEEFTQEVVNSVTKRTSLSEAIASTSRLLSGNSDALKAFQKVKSVGDIENLGESFKLDSELVDKLKQDFSSRLDMGRTAEKVQQHAAEVANFNPITKARESTIAYFTNPDKAIRNTRIATVAGAYGATAVGMRYMNGGTLTRDQYGRRDIAGIPFI